MSLLMFTSRKHFLISQKFALEKQLLDKTRRLSDMQQYAANISDGSVSIFDMTNVPSSMFGRTMMYMNYSHNMALQNAQMNFTAMQPILAQQTANMDAQSQAMYMQWVQQNLYKQERERIAKIEANMLNAQEKELTLEKEKIEAQLKMVEAELESVKEAEKKGIEQFAPKYVG